MRSITLAGASERGWDVVVAGSSFAAVFFAHALPAGLDVLMIEKGGDVPHRDQVASGWGLPETFVQRNTSPYEKAWIAFTLFGGNSNHWWGNAPRLHPDDFVLRSRFGVGEDWPIGYADLEPHWFRAETLMEVSGGGSDHVLPRHEPFPFPPHAPSRADVALRASSDLWWAMPTGISNGGSRPMCCANGVCGVCPIDAKFTILNGWPRLEHPRARVLLDTEVRAVEIAGGRARGVRVRGRDGVEATIGAQTVGLGANGIFNAAILLRSDVRAPALGRYLHEQAHQDVLVDTATIRGFFGGTSETGHGYHFYHGIDRSSAGAVLLETVNAPASIRREPGRWANRIHFRLIAEDLPRAENRVTLEDDEPVIDWVGHDDYAYRGLARARNGLPGIIPDAIDRIEPGLYHASEAHIQGTHRMGRAPETSVTDDRMRVHGVPNLYVLGAGAFPACSPANPTLTIAALSLRASETVG